MKQIRFMKVCLWVLIGFMPVALLGEDKSPMIKTELLTLTTHGDFHGLYYQNGDEVVEISAHSGGMSAPILYRGPRILSFYTDKKDAEPPSGNEKPPKPNLQVAIPKGSDRTLLIFVPGKDGAIPKVRAYGISDSALGEEIIGFSTSRKKGPS